MMAGRVRAAANLGTSGGVPSQSYGNTAMGACPKITKLQKSNLAIASGLGLHVGASASIAIEWVYGPKSHPMINNSIGHVN